MDERVCAVFRWTNLGTTPVGLSRVLTSCGCSAASWSHEQVDPGKSGTLNVTVDTTGFARDSDIRKTATAFFGSSRDAGSLLTVLARVRPRVELNPSSITFCAERITQTTATIEMRPVLMSPDAFRDVRISCQHEHFTIRELHESGDTRKIQILPAFTAGLKTADLRLRFIGRGEDASFVCTVPVKVVPATETVTVSPSRYFAFLRNGSDLTSSRFHVSSSANEPIWVTDVRPNDPDLVAPELCADSKGEFSIRLKRVPTSKMIRSACTVQYRIDALDQIGEMSLPILILVDESS